MRTGLLFVAAAMTAFGCGGAPTSALFDGTDSDGSAPVDDGGGSLPDGASSPDASPHAETCLQASGVCSTGACPFAYVPAPSFTCAAAGVFGSAQMQCCITEDLPPDGGTTFPCGDETCFDCAGVACLATQFCVNSCTCGGVGTPGSTCVNPPPTCTDTAPWPGAKPATLISEPCAAVSGGAPKQ